MDYATIHRCIQILHEKPRWFFQRDNVSEKLQCFDTIQKLGSPSTINSIFHFLRSDNFLIQTKAAESITVLFGKLKSLKDYADTLKHLNIEENDFDFYRVNFDEKTYFTLVGIASLNGSGYVREKAVKEITSLRNGEGLKFILLRLGDWVAAVRKAANQGVLSYLEIRYIDDLLQQLPAIDWLLQVKRSDLSEIHHRLIQFILSQDLTLEFYNKVAQLDDKTRLYFYRIYLCNKKPTKEQLFWISEDANFLVRIELIKYLSAFDTDAQKVLIEIFLNDSSARVRLEALYESKRLSPFFDNQLIKMLSDEVASVRELSRSLLGGEGIDFAELYKQRIGCRQFLSGSLLGLSETGNSEDLPIFEQYIHSDKSKEVVACLIAINRFNSDKGKHCALELLVHPNKKVRDKAVEILAKSADTETLQRVRVLYSNADYTIKKAILKLFNKVGGWNIVGDLLLALADKDANIQNLGWQLLDKWKAKSIRLFTTPPSIEIERVNKILGGLDPGNLTMTNSREKLLRDLRFFLR